MICPVRVSADGSWRRGRGTIGWDVVTVNKFIKMIIAKHQNEGLAKVDVQYIVSTCIAYIRLY
jgi:hypothetical protein